MDTIEKAVKKLEEDRSQAVIPDDTSVGETPSALETESPAGVVEAAAAPSSPGSDRRITLDLSRLQAGSIVDPSSEQKDFLAEEFRRIKQPLLKHARGQGASQVQHANLIMVTSSIAGEGKTFTSINLALSIAMERDKTVLLVDADVAKPEVTKRLGIQAEKGLSDVLLDDDVWLNDVLIRTDIPNLSILPAGRQHPHATELLASHRMSSLADEMSTRYADRIIIFDTPPLLLTSEARVLAGLMGQILVVVEESRTPQPVLQEALGMLEGVEIVGLVLNKTHHQAGGEYYGYGYGYGYGK
ncbi:XrtA-associated tyrosine autokinase [Thiohalobacter sp. IOR34]|uniref:XrtA-associated tyrosine autokinase n=1 Tax=Thiohalobacter sp. IOR34 TaxID=3057176 RepID=UPI0025B1CAAF|nr:XrtA-associated tyrosine autokinase [Thiohalobacter sp. IOR34]WJW74465.1 XrtA-associated tyrosine autokinase [Thiohalobacter sp. IOR34]